MAYTPQPLTKRQQYEQIRSQLEQERSSFIGHWKDIGDYLFPRGPRFNVTDVNQGYKKNQNIIDSTATLSLRTLRSGMMSGVTSPARPWFRVMTPDEGLNETANVKAWLYLVSERMSTIFLRSNLYNALPAVYGYMGGFGTAAMMIEEDMDDVVRFFPFPIGSYSIANNHKLQVNTFCRTFRMTVRQLVEKFGLDRETNRIDWKRMSDRIKNYWENSQYDMWIDVTHVIKPNENHDPRELAAKYKKFISVYYETGTISSGSSTSGYDPNGEIMLRESGYDYFPVLCPRWEMTGEDVYGTSCPGMDALGDIKQLQTGEKRSAEAIEKMVRPPMQGSAELKSQKASILPGDMTYLPPGALANGGMKPIFQVNPQIQELEQKQDRIRQRIQRCFFEDLFLMLSESDRRQITAREVDERHEEKLLALGPVLEQLNQDLLDPLIDITFTIMNRQRIIPPPPKELQGAPLQVEYISIMAQAQKLIGIEGIERFIGFVGQVNQADPNAGATDKIDIDQAIEIYGDMTSVPPGIIRSDDQVQAIRQQKQEAQAQAQKQQQMQSAADTAQKLSQTDTGGQNMLNQLLQQAQAGNLVPQR